MSNPAAQAYLSFDGRPSTIYVRAQASKITAVDNLLAAGQPAIPRPGAGLQPLSVLTAQLDVAAASRTLFFGPGAVALLAGAAGVADIMVISVLERRSEIRLRRALGRPGPDPHPVPLRSQPAGPAGRRRRDRRRGHGHLRPRQGPVGRYPLQAWAGGPAAGVIIGAAAGLLAASG
jgi:putative ABC transport system permease protein